MVPYMGSANSPRVAAEPLLHNWPIGQVLRIPHRRVDGVDGFVIAIEPPDAAVSALADHLQSYLTRHIPEI
jgi:hypothetical protein